MTDNWKAIGVGITLAGMVFAAGGGWYEVRQLRLDMEENSRRDQKLLEMVTEMREEAIVRGTELAKIGVLSDRLGVTNERLNSQQQQITNHVESQKTLLGDIADLKSQTSDRVFGVQIERWILEMAKNNPELEVPSLPNK